LVEIDNPIAKRCSNLEGVLDFVSSSDVRRGGKWKRSQRLKNDAIWVLASLALAGARLIPPKLRAALGWWLGALAHVGARGPRRQALANVALALPHLDPSARRALVRRCFRTLGELLGETVGLLGGPDAWQRLPLTSDAATTLERARSEGRGVIFASAHLGPWERVAASIAAAGVPFTVLTRDSYDPRFSRVQNRMRRGAGVGVIRRSTSRPTSATRAVLRALRRGDVVGIVMDLRARVASCEAPFLGTPALTALGPARIALRTGAPVVVGSAAPAGTEAAGQWVVTATRIVTDDLFHFHDSARELTARINAELSLRILAMPHAWVWMHPRWAGQGEL
jgi:Kdo2-lipid IVA lauroyltransferase/acyltransferase